MNHQPDWKQQAATKLAASSLLRYARQLHENHPADLQLGGSVWKKFWANVYLIMADYGTGKFPPRHTCREDVFQSEKTQIARMEFAALDEVLDIIMRKPWVDERLFGHHVRDLIRMIETMEKRGLRPPAKLLELGCGAGWLSEILALRGYRVTGTSISELEVDHAQLRVDAVKARRLQCELNFLTSTMEDIHRNVPHDYDAAFCYEALHHVFDWRESLDSITQCLKPGGWMFLFDEPSTIHTYACYRTSKINKTHEIGFRGSELKQHIRKLGYQNISFERPVRGDGLKGFCKRFLPFTIEHGSVISRAYWISAQKPPA
jgi:2-polyprenyl-3-methyl-5-hydroxy-6-metoxy-1,4-benzoquinol methylase